MLRSVTKKKRLLGYHPHSEFRAWHQRWNDPNSTFCMFRIVDNYLLVIFRHQQNIARLVECCYTILFNSTMYRSHIDSPSRIIIPTTDDDDDSVSSDESTTNSSTNNNARER